jgi:hypothetical protein
MRHAYHRNIILVRAARIAALYYTAFAAVQVTSIRLSNGMGSHENQFHKGRLQPTAGIVKLEGSGLIRAT